MVQDHVKSTLYEKCSPLSRGGHLGIFGCTFVSRVCQNDDFVFQAISNLRILRHLKIRKVEMAWNTKSSFWHPLTFVPSSNCQERLQVRIDGLEAGKTLECPLFCDTSLVLTRFFRAKHFICICIKKELFWSLRIFLWTKPPAFSRQLFFIAYLFEYFFANTSQTLAQHRFENSTAELFGISVDTGSLAHKSFSQVKYVLMKFSDLVLFSYTCFPTTIWIFMQFCCEKKFSWKCGRQHHLMWHGYIVMSTRCAIW